MDARAVVEEYLRYMTAIDFASALHLFAEDAVYQLHVPDGIVPFAGEASGRDRIEVVFYQMQADWFMLRFAPTIVAVDGDQVRVSLSFTYQHRVSGMDLDGHARGVITVRDGAIVRFDEYHDAALVTAFMKAAGAIE